MFFENENLKISILSVLYLTWEKNCAYAAKRPYNALSFRIKGNADFEHAEKKLHVKDGDVIYVPQDYDYYLSGYNEELFVVHFEIDNFHETVGDISAIASKNFAYYEKKFRTLYELWSKKQIGYEYECASVFYKILAELYKQNKKQELDLKNDVLNDAIEYIHEHFTEQNLSIAQLAASAGMSDTYFRKLFVSALGSTPLKYINNLRISYAIELLRSGYFQVEEVAEKSGFSNQKYLSNVLKKKTGNTPTSYKNKLNADKN